MSDDQNIRKSTDFNNTNPEVIERIKEKEINRIKEVMRILKQIKTPSTDNVGLDGSRAIWLIALHNWDYENAGMIILNKMKRLYYREKTLVFYPGIPYLVDRIMVGKKHYDHNAKQLYGTQGWVNVSNKKLVSSGSYPIFNPSHLAERRKKFCLTYNKETAMKCTHK